MRDPLTAFMRRLAHPTKFILVGCAILMAIAVPLFGFFESQTQRIEVATQEHRWAVFARPLIPLLNLVERHYLLYKSAAAGNSAAATKLLILTDKINLKMKEFNKVNETVGRSLDVHSFWPTVQRNWNELLAREPGLNARDAAIAYAHIRTGLWDLLVQASYYAHLSQDRHQATRSEIELMRIDLPTLLHRLARLRELFSDPSTANAGWRENYQQAMQLASQIRWSSVAAIVQDAGKTFTDQPKLTNDFARPLQNIQISSNAILRMLEVPPPASRFRAIQQARLMKDANAMSNAASTLAVRCITSMVQQFKDRIDSLRLELFYKLGIILIVTALTAFLFVAMYRSLTGAILERLSTEKRLRYVKDMYAALSQINSLIAQRRAQDTLLTEICENTVKAGRFELAFIGFQDKLVDMPRTAASAGKAVGFLTGLTTSGASAPHVDEENILESNLIQDRLSAGNSLPVLEAVATGEPIIINDLFASSNNPSILGRLEFFSLRAVAAFPVRRRGTAVGALVIYSARKDAFDDQFRTLLTEIANSISFALDDLDRENLRRAAEQALRDSEQRYHLVMEGAGDAIILMEESGKIVEVNRRAVEQFGYSRDALLGMHGSELFPPEVQAEVKARYDRLVQTGERIDSTSTAMRRDQRTFPMDIVESRVELQGKCLMLAIFRDISERKAAEERIHYLAYHDSLTGLPNRTLLIDRLEQAIRQAHRHNAMLGVIFIDLDNFKTVNDTLGHEFGDELLQGAAMRIRSALRSEDTVARLGGDEFIVLISDPKTTQDVAYVAAKIIESMAVPFIISGHTFHITCSIGMSVYPRDGKDSGVLMRTADEALYQVKKEGRNHAAFHTPEMHAAALEYVRMENDLREALKGNQFLLHYQPQVDLQTGKIIGAEALVRWLHPQRGLVPPTKFIALAEEKGIILPLGTWILEEACRQTRAWQRDGVPVVPVSVNLSPLQCREVTLAHTVRRVLRETGLNPALLELEITESTLMAQTETLRARMIEIKNLGIRFSLDDFGTGYSSLSYLTRFPIDTLKIDRSFVRDMIDDPKDLAVVDTIVDLADNLQLRTVAEGVEKMEQITLLKLLGCHSIQGYYFSRPVPADDFQRMLSDDTRLNTSAPDAAAGTETSSRTN